MGAGIFISPRGNRAWGKWSTGVVGCQVTGGGGGGFRGTDLVFEAINILNMGFLSPQNVSGFIFLE